MDRNPQCYIPSFVEIGALAPEIFGEFLQYWSCEADNANKLCFYLPVDAPDKIGIDFPSSVGENV